MVLEIEILLYYYRLKLGMLFRSIKPNSHRYGN